MRCAWKELLSLLPMWMRECVDKHSTDILQEVRLRLGYKPELIGLKGSDFLQKTVTQDDLSFCINSASNYSPWAADTTAKGYITALGGHRVGICGSVVYREGRIVGIKNISSLCIRVARDFYGISKGLGTANKSILIIGKPGSGKTTLLRDIIRVRSNAGQGSVSVVDEKGEIFPRGFEPGKKTDVLTGCSKPLGIEIALRNMGPSVIAVDEITAQQDCEALLEAGWCGVDVFATVHAADQNDLRSRSIYKYILDSRLFSTVITMRSDKTWFEERINYAY